MIGDDNVIRESVTFSRAASDETPTRIGSRGYWMANTHAGHDVLVGDGCTVANGGLLAGHVQMGDGVMIGGNAAVHQNVRLGRGSMLGGTCGVIRDLPPFFMATGLNLCGSINLVGMRRSGMPSDQIDDVRWVFKTLYRRGLPLKRAVEELESRAERPLVAEYLEFVRSSERGLCPGLPDARRATTAPD